MESIAIAPSRFPPNLSTAASPPPFSPTNFFPPLLPQLPLLKPSSSSPPFLAHPKLASSLLNAKTRFQLGGELFRPFLGTLLSPNPGESSLAGTGRLTRTPQLTRAIGEEFDVPPVKSDDAIDQEHGSAACLEMEGEDLSSNNVGGFSGDGPYIFDRSAPAPVGAGNGANEVQVLAASQTLYQPRFVWFARSEEEESRHLDRAINGTIAGAVGIFTITKILTVDHDYWQGWTVFEILRYAPIHNWSAYEDALKHNPILAKMMISGAVYSLGDWIAQCYEGKPILDFNRTRMFRSGLVGFCLHGSLSHFYYYLCEALFPFKEWWVVPVKVAFDQTIWSGVWNSIYYVTLGLLRFESPSNILSELKATFWPLLTAGWKLWPFAHVITYGVVPVEQRLLWVDCVELVWVTILSMYSNEKAEARILEASNEAADVTVLEHEGNSSEVQ